MNGVDAPQSFSLTVPAARQIDEVCDRLEAAWQAGQTLRLEELLLAVGEPVRPALLRQLLLLEWEYLQERDQPLVLDDYLRRFPRYQALVHQTFAEFNAEAPSIPVTSGRGRLAPLAAQEWNDLGYLLLSQLGRGGMGTVYLACQTAADRLVALKLLQDDVQEDPAALDRFRREATTLGRLQHPHIVPIFEVGACQGRPYYTMEYCPGGSLADYLRGGLLSPTEAAALLETLARATHSAHQANIVHRDLKPGNVLLASPAASAPGVVPAEPARDASVLTRAKLADFGLARKLDAVPQTQTGTVVGTPSYMAPEQARGESKSVGPAADVHALGAILYECVTGRPPFLGQTPLDTILQVVADEPVSPARLQPRLPRDLETICLKCLHKEPHARYASAEELADDLRRFLDCRPILARPLGPLARAWRWCRRNRLVAGLLVLVVVVLCIGLASTTVMWLRAQSNYERAEGLQVQAEDNLRESEKNFDNSVEAVEQYFNRVSQNRLLFLPGMAALRQELMSSARPFFEQFVAQRQDDPRLRFRLARAIYALADIETSTGAVDKAWPLWEDAQARLKAAHEEDPQNHDYRSNLALCQRRYGEALATAGRNDKAKKVLAEASAHFAAMAGRAPKKISYAESECECRQSLAGIVAAEGDQKTAVEQMRAALDKFLASPALNPREPAHQMHIGLAHSRLGQVLNRAEQAAASAKELEKARAVLTSAANRAFFGQAIARYYLARALGELGLSYLDQKRYAEGEQVMLAAQELLDQFAREGPTVKDYRYNRSVNLHNLGLLYQRWGKRDEADRGYQSAIRDREQLRQEYPKDPLFALELANSYRQCVALARDRKNDEERLRYNAKAIELLRELVVDHRSPRAVTMLVGAAGGRGELLQAKQQFAQALPDLDLAVTYATGGLQNRLRAGRAYCRAKTGDWKGALEDCAADPDSANVQYIRACALSYALVVADSAVPKEKADQIAGETLRRFQVFLSKVQSDRKSLRELLTGDAEFKALRDRQDFQHFLKSL